MGRIKELAIDEMIKDLNLHEIKALSWKEPYGTLMLHGKIETRTWGTNYRGLVLICCSKMSYTIKKIGEISQGKQFERIFRTLPRGVKFGNGMAIAIGNLVDCRPMTQEDEYKCFVKYHPDLFCHVYENVTPIKPIPIKGKQGWFKVPEEIIKQIEVLK